MRKPPEMPAELMEPQPGRTPEQALPVLRQEPGRFRSGLARPLVSVVPRASVAPAVLV